ncbi:MAG TPA: LLM class flavin-dependent oxidoreductase [Acidimicrobiales bacterium]|jgi:alkanesulfonate monooxygenase SsuD/methylene tetrahydromethanopterin reductase-like flavin-dependent oxidoreductase (luciferase family)|nr:LLM class flavin-dependent oxidoreductase [Acidimicrobiales bacterium]
MKLGLMTLGDLLVDPVTGAAMTPEERYRMLIDAAVMCDEAGFHSINLGEHHGLGYEISSPPVLLAAIAERTTNLRLSTAVTLLANLDTFRLAEDYATVDVISGGRVEIVAGRGNFFASTYTLFGQHVDESRDRFDEALRLLCQLWTGEGVEWEGRFRPSINGEPVMPHPLQTGVPPIWIGGGSSADTATIAGQLGLKLMLPSAFGPPAKFRDAVDIYLEAFAAAGHDHDPEVGASWHVNVSRDSQDAKDRWEKRYEGYHAWTQQLLKQVNPNVPDYLLKPFNYEWLCSSGPAIVGSPAEVADRIASLGQMLGADLHLCYMDMGGLPAAELFEMVELMGGEVLPAIARA